MIVVLYLPTALLVEAFPAPSPLTTCMAECPSNAFMLVGSEPAWVESVVIPMREALTVLLTLAVVTRLAFRMRNATRLMRKALMPVFAFAMIRTLALGLASSFVAAGPTTPPRWQRRWLGWGFRRCPSAFSSACCAGGSIPPTRCCG